MDKLEEYKLCIEKFYKYRALRDYDKSLASITCAIEICPVNEALGYLKQMRDSLDTILTPMQRLKKIVGLKK